MPAKRVLSIVIPLVFAGPVSAGVTPTGEFNGTHTEYFNDYSTVHAVQTLPVFGGLGTLSNLTDGGAIKIERSSNFNGDQIWPMSGMMCGQLGVGEWVFSSPVDRFGGWWENNSGTDDALVEFFDSGGALVGQSTATVSAAAQQWTWNGWAFDEPVSRIVVTGNGVFNGFLWYETLQVDFIPAPATVGPLCLVLWPYRRRRP